MQNLKNLFDLSKKIVVITGGAGLLGYMHAEAVMAYGGIPIIIDINKESIDKCLKELKSSYSGEVYGFAVDISNEEEVEKFAQTIKKEFIKLDGLINNAANNPRVENDGKDFSRLENFCIETWNKDIAVGLTGSFLCSKYLGYLISKNEEGGSIINISSDLGLIGPNQSLYETQGKPHSDQQVKPVTYSVVKTGIIGLTRYLATYWVKEGVRCNAICPGGVENGQSEDFVKKLSKQIPMGRLAQSSEYQGAIVWLLSDASSYLNGAIIPIDGGRTSW